jgi:hypothetical protein
MAGTLLVYDQDFPRATSPAGRIRNSPAIDELRANHYPEPCQLLPIPAAFSPDQYCAAMRTAAGAITGGLDRLIIFGHGHVVNAATPGGITRVTTGIVLGAAPLTAANARLLRGASPMQFTRTAQAELWVCEAASTGQAGGQSGVMLCQAIADALAVPVFAARSEQEYSSDNQTELPNGGGWQSTITFLPWEGPTVLFNPRGGRHRRSMHR